MNDFKISKYMSYILRHNPQGMSISIDGWMEVEDLLKLLNRRFSFNIQGSDIERIVLNNDKKRFKIKSSKIRASQGHSLKQIDLNLIPKIPPEYLYHGTKRSSFELISKEGLRKLKRHHVHLSKDRRTAINVANRWREHNLILRIHSKEMYHKGHTFYLSENGVWLTDHVPPQYIEKIE